jgi:hypothetical protein
MHRQQEFRVRYRMGFCGPKATVATLAGCGIAGLALRAVVGHADRGAVADRGNNRVVKLVT